MKGEYGQECNITSCQKSNSAYWYNHSTRKYYCEDCAHRLNSDEFNRRGAWKMFGHDLCTYEKKFKKVAIVGSGLDSQHLTKTVKEKPILTDYLHNMINESEELTFYARHFGGFKENLTAKVIKNLQPKELEKEYNLIQEKKSNRSKRERDLIVYYYETSSKNSSKKL